MQGADKKIKMLFLCAANSARSQMAEGWVKGLYPETIEAHSAGIEARGLDPCAVIVMREAGVDISGQRSKTVDELSEIHFDLVVTVCGRAAERCPVFPPVFTMMARVIHVGFDDPPVLAAGVGSREEALVHYRRVCVEIRGFVEGLPKILKKEKIY